MEITRDGRGRDKDCWSINLNNSKQFKDLIELNRGHRLSSLMDAILIQLDLMIELCGKIPTAVMLEEFPTWFKSLREKIDIPAILITEFFIDIIIAYL